MGFKFSRLCDLLSSLESNKIAKASTAARKNDPDIQTVTRWFDQHEGRIHHTDTDRLALLSCMFPEKRTDRVYWLQESTLARVVGRCLFLGSSRLAELDRWRTSVGFDLGQCVENVMRQAENHVPDGQQVSVEEIDQALGMIASRCRFSGPRIRQQQTALSVERALAPLYRRLSSRDAKWLTRMILKSYSLVNLPQNYTLKRFHFLLPQLLQFQDSFEGALDMLVSEPMNHFPPRPEPVTAETLSIIALDYLRPRAGIKIGRPEYFKARSIKHCCQLVNGRRMSIERKYDGEYCQVHVDLTNGHGAIQIFSKSGKDSTADRSGIIPVLEKSLLMRRPDCRFTRRCIIEGELLVWSDKHGRLMDFHKLRKFLPRSGTFIDVENDSPPQPYEHLMIVFFDILLLDDDVCLKRPHRERRLLLQDVVQKIPGRAAIAEQEILDFHRADSHHRLGVRFAKAIAHRWEGLVLKTSDDPYFPIYASNGDDTFGRWIKLKKDYIPGLGDTMDLALIGACYDPRDAAVLQQPGWLQWTHFFVGCLLNKDEVVQVEAVPRFRVIDVINRHCMNQRTLHTLNQFGAFHACTPEGRPEFKVEHGYCSLPAMSTLFKKPFVVEMMGSGFEKPSGGRYYTLRFPRVLKIHMDRTFEEAVSFRELQLLAESARAVPVEDLSQEREQWAKRLKAGNRLGQYIVRRSQSPSSTSYSSREQGLDPPSHNASYAMSSDSEDSEQSSRRAGGMVGLYPISDDCVHVFNDGLTPATACIKETTMSAVDGPRCQKNVLTEIENLSCRKSCSQTGSEPSSENSKHTVRDNNGYGKSMPAEPSGLSSPMRTTSLSAVHQKPVRNAPELAAYVKGTSSSPGSTKRKRTPRSPLDTIPIYMPDAPLEEVPFSSKLLSRRAEPSTDLHQFFQHLGSEGCLSTLQQSNPCAASRCIPFGMVLLNAEGPILGKEILRVGTALADTLRGGSTSLPLKGKISFLDSRMLEQKLNPKDIRFCLRSTWSNIADQYYYACLSWDLGSRTSGEVRDDVIGSNSPCFQLDKQSRGIEGGTAPRLPALTVSFDKDEILALGEYRSIEPLRLCHKEDGS